jgi:hypothetical protein
MLKARWLNVEKIPFRRRFLPPFVAVIQLVSMATDVIFARGRQESAIFACICRISLITLPSAITYRSQNPLWPGKSGYPRGKQA